MAARSRSQAPHVDRPARAARRQSRRAGAPLRGLPDHVQPGVRALFVGINPGVRSATVGHHFAGYTNRFWKLLHESGLVPEPVTYAEDARLPEWGYGITNLVARPTPGIADLSPEEFAAGRSRLLAKIARLRPEVVALVGVTLYRPLFPAARSAKEHAKKKERAGRLRLGLQSESLLGSRIFVLPNPSGRNANFSYEEMLQAFRALKAYLDAGRRIGLESEGG